MSSIRRAPFLTRVLCTALAGALLLALALLVPGRTAVAAPGDPWWEPANRPAPDSGIDVTGAPFKGTDKNGDVRGFADLHNHVMTNEGFGGRMICGKPFSQKGIADALKDCPEHYPDGLGAIFENLTADPDWHHDPVGWPTFKDWPRHDSLSHQQNYYAWIERAWRGGLRVMVTDLTSNGIICSLPIMPKDRGCDEMDSVRLQAAKTYEMQDYIDQVYGGAGRGFFRIVTSPEQAQQVIESGRLAVVLGVETSEPFGCKQVLDVAQCSRADIDRGLDELHALGVRSMFLCHKVDNALCGVRFDTGTQGTLINIGQFLSTGTFWRTEQCRGPQYDNPIGNAPAPSQVPLPPGTSLPSYDPDARCNVRGLTRLGEYAVKGLMKRHMMLEIDHMSVKAADRALSMLEGAAYPGVLSSHSWMDLGWTERVFRLGGMSGIYDSAGPAFVQEAARTDALRTKYDKGIGLGMDMNGVGGWPAPRGADAPNKVEYPFRSVDGGAVLDRQVTGERTWDVNTDGAAHYGLMPDWIEDIRRVGGTDAVHDLFQGARTYLDTWAATTAYDAPENLARSSWVTASSAEWWSFHDLSGWKARDGDTDTRWASLWSDDQWLQIDLRQPRTVSRMLLDWEAAYARGYRIEVSDDASTWRTVWSTDQGNGGLDVASFAPVTARYLRVHGVTRATGYGYSLWEVQVFGT